MERDEEVKEKLLPTIVSKENPSEIQSLLSNPGKMHSTIITNEKESENGQNIKNEDNEGDLR